jgi:hypothetical protein
MNASTRLFFLLILVFVTINTLAQNGLEGKKSIYLQLGASGGFSPNLPQPVLIPQLGLDATFGIIGFRATGQFFKTSPEFDINGYLDPIKSVLTISDLKEYNSNVLLGVSPYLSFGKKALSIQPGVGLKYLMQKGATATAVYYQPPGTTILNFPDGDANRNLFVIEPNIRASFGKPGHMLRFFIEAGYLLPLGENEFSYTSRDLTRVVDPKGNIDIKALLNSKQVTSTENSIPAFASIGAGLEIKLFSGKGQDKPSDQQSGYAPPKPINPKEKLNEPDSYEIYEIKPLMIISKGAERPQKKENTVEFTWLALNTDDCGPLQYEFTITEIKDTKSRDAESDLIFLGIQNQPIYKKLLNEKNLNITGNNLLKYVITKNEMPVLFEEGKQFRWQVTALDATGNFPQCAWGGNNVANSEYSNLRAGECVIQLEIDTIRCVESPNSNFNYELCFHIINNSSNPPCDNTIAEFGPTSLEIIGYSNGNNVGLIATSNPNVLNGINLGFNQSTGQLCLNIAANSSIDVIKVKATPSDAPSGSGVNDYASFTDQIILPPCGCNFCDSVSITVVNPEKPPIQSIPQSGYDVISMPVSITYSPWPVNRVVAEIVAFQHVVNTNTCITCNTENRMHGVFVGTAQNHIVGNTNPWLNSGNAYLYPFSREATWSTFSPSGVLLNNQEFFLNMGVPIMNSLICCQDRIKWTIRYSFVTVDQTTGECRVCENLKSYCLIRTGTQSTRSLSCWRMLPVPIPISLPPIKTIK